MSKFLREIATSWILPDGSWENVPSECHDRYIPYPFQTTANAEKRCIRVSCHWGWSAGASYIQVPKGFTHYQLRILNRMDNECPGLKNIEYDGLPISIIELNDLK